MTITIRNKHKVEPIDTIDLSTHKKRGYYIGNGQITFIGTPADYKNSSTFAHKLYLIAYDCVVCLEDVRYTWDTIPEWTIDKWVDIDIVIN